MIGFDFLGLQTLFNKIIILLVGGIYKLVGGVYQVFLILAKTNIFTEEHYQNLSEKVYVILAVAMLFIIAYNFLTLIVDPDKDKNGTDIQKMLRNTVIAFIMIALTPTLFTFAYDVQNSVLDTHTIEKLFDPDTTDTEYSESIKLGGNMMGVNTFRAFFYPTGEQEDLSDGEATEDQEPDRSLAGDIIKGIFTLGIYNIINAMSDTPTLRTTTDYVQETGHYSAFAQFAKNVTEDHIEFHWFAAIIAGCYLIYVLLSFCFDLAVRVVKLAFYQIVAPICIACKILPKQDSIFNNWWKSVSKTYLSVFIKVFFMQMSVYLIRIVTVSDNGNAIDNMCADANMACGFFAKGLAKALLILGIITFLRQSSKIIDELFNLGDTKLGIRDKLKEGGAYAIGGAAIGAGTAAIRQGVGNFARQRRQAIDNGTWNGKSGAKAKLLGRSLFTGARAGLSGGISAGKAGASAGSFKDMRASANKEADNVVKKEFDRQAYRAAHSADGGYFDDLKRSTIARIKDTGADIASWAGYKNVQDLQLENAQIDAVNSAWDNFEDQASAFGKKEYDNKGVLNFQVKDDNGVVATVDWSESKDIKDAISAASQSADGRYHGSDARYQGLSIEELRARENKVWRAAHFQTMQAVAVDQATWDSYDKKTKEKLGKLRNAWENAQGTIRNNAHLSAFQNSDLTAQEFQQGLGTVVYATKNQIWDEVTRSYVDVDTGGMDLTTYANSLQFNGTNWVDTSGNVVAGLSEDSISVDASKIYDEVAGRYIEALSTSFDADGNQIAIDVKTLHYDGTNWVDGAGNVLAGVSGGASAISARTIANGGTVQAKTQIFYDDRDEIDKYFKALKGEKATNETYIIQSKQRKPQEISDKK